MPYPYFSHNGQILPSVKATVSLSRLEYSYGFGVYETIRVVGGRSLFMTEHCARLLNSAKIIGLKHGFEPRQIQQFVSDLLGKNRAGSCNLKLLLVGAASKDSASLDIICSNPLFPDRRLYKTGAKLITYKYEREFPQAKTLNMLSSYLAYSKARRAGAYDALLVDRNGNVREGTRTNLFGLKHRTLVSPPVRQILAGVTRAKVLEVARKNGFDSKEQDIPARSLREFDSLFVTSTSSKILPICAVDAQTDFEISANLRALINLFNEYLAAHT